MKTLYEKFLTFLGYRSRCCGAETYTHEEDWKDRTWCSKCGKEV